MKITYGEEVKPEPVQHENDANHVWGPYWLARRKGDGFVLEYDSGSINGRMRSYPITTDEFERLRADPGQFEPIDRARGH